MMDLTPLLYISMAMGLSLLLLIWELLLAIPVISVISVISAIPVISPISCVDFPIVLLLLRGHHATWLKEPSLGLGGLNAYISDYK
jgi:hypothetical protein